LDLGDEDRRRAKNYLAQFNTDNTLDELGFGAMRDSFAEIFFPATNTIMTRTRYLVFVAGLCWIVEEEKLEGKRAANRLTELENQLREALCKEEFQGVIGAQAKEELQRFPSSTYWSGLRELGIFCHRHWGLTYYQTHLRDVYRARKADIDDDGLPHVDSQIQRNWDPKFCDILLDGRSFLPEGKNHLPVSLSFALTKQEARYLKERFLDLARSQKRASVLSHLLSIGKSGDFSFPWDAPHPDELASYVRHARYLSMFVRGTTLHYFHLLSRERQRQNIADETDTYRDLFERWWTAARQELASWNTDEFVEVARRIDAIKLMRDPPFINGWLAFIRSARNASDVIDSVEAESLIRQRESVTRKYKGRFLHPEYLKRWRPPEGNELRRIERRLEFGLNYRADIGYTFVDDILHGIGRSH